MVLYRVLGPVEVGSDGQVADLGPPKQRALLAILLLNANEIVPVDRITELLWPEGPPRRAEHAIQVYVSELRRALEPLAGREVLAWQTPGYVLRIDRDALDAHLVERLTAEGVQQLAASDLAAADATLGRARELWRGPPLAEFVYEEFAQDDIHHLTDVWLQGTEALAEVKLGLGDDAVALSLAEAALREDPLRDRPREVEMLSLYRLGRGADALRAYERYRSCLADELAAEPSPKLQRLRESILVHDVSLAGQHGQPVAKPRASRNPYKGLRPFTEADAPDFHGREALVQRVLGALTSGCRLITLVGPSGSGKSSTLVAGVMPALHSAAITGSDPSVVAHFRPGRHPSQALHAALARRTANHEFVLLIDQFEEIFDPANDAECDQVLAELTAAVSDRAGRTRAILALRADAYDRPLQHAAFAEAFLAGVVNVVPMNASELEAAIVEPARRVGVDVEPALLAELVSDTINRPGALPLLQHVLAELYDRRADARLTREAYQALGGLRGALTNRAESAYASLDAERQLAAQQVLLRLVKVGDGQRDMARTVPIRELAELATDPVILSDVLHRFEAERLMSFDRDPVSGDAIVEVAHEALLSEWDRLASWISHGRTDLKRHETLAARVAEWDALGRQPEDLLAGSRLDDCVSWARETAFGLTARESAFIEASLSHRRLEEADLEARAASERRLERRARFRLFGFLGAGLLLIAALTYGIVAWPGRAPDVVLVYPGPGDGSMYDSIKSGFDDAVTTSDTDAVAVNERPDALRERLGRLAEQGVGLIVVGQAWSNPDVELVAREHPSTRFLALDYWGELPNVSAPKFAYEEGSFLVGVAAALRSQSGRVGVITDADTNIDWPFAGGFEAGALAADPAVQVTVSYLPGTTTHLTFATVSRAAHAMFMSGVDVIFYAGRSAPLGVFEAAFSESQSQGRQLWAIAIDSDWYAALPFAGPLEGRDAAAWRSHALLSMVTRYDVGVSTMLTDYARGALAPGDRRFGLAQGAFDVATSGGFVDDIRPMLDNFRDRIVAGEIMVPKYPSDRGPPR